MNMQNANMNGVLDMENLDYKKLGFACGLEIHQRLLTKEKLFCSCDPTLPEPSPSRGYIVRMQRAVAGELGEVDRAAKFEEAKQGKFRYNLFNASTCLVEIDEEPPHPLNAEALEIALSIASALGLKLVDELQPMRKEVVDGSNPSAFQRTIMLGSDGSVKLGNRSIPISMMSLEEESAGIEGRSGSEIIYNTDRIGIPLVEIDTDASIASPQEAKELALKIGTILRLAGKVQRGIGSIRQDVNVSIKEGARVEIKGVQELDSMDRLIENEVLRQVRLVEIAKRLKAGHASVGAPVDITPILKSTAVRVIANQLKAGGAAVAFAMKGFKGVVGTELQPNRRLGSEISDYAKMYGVNGIIHSDEDLHAYGFSEEELSSIRHKLSLGEHDAFAIVAGPKESVSRAAESAIERAKYAIVGVPLETRGVLDTEECTTRFLRPLPGGSRMYPETDLLPVAITEEMRRKAKSQAPDIEKETAILSEQAGAQNALQLMLSPRLQLYKRITNSVKDYMFVANTLLQKFTELKRNGFEVDSIDEDKLASVFRLYEDRRITKQAVEEVLKELSRSTSADVEKIITDKKLERVTGKELEKEVSKMLKGSEFKGVGEAAAFIMSRMRLNVDGTELNSIISKLLKPQAGAKRKK